jgi:hypothetical protein
LGTLRKLARFYGARVLDSFRPSQTNPYLGRPKDRKKLNADHGVQVELLALFVMADSYDRQPGKYGFHGTTS